MSEAQIPFEKKPLGVEDYIDFHRKYMNVELVIAAAMRKVAELDEDLQKRANSCVLAPQGTDALCRPVADAYGALSQARTFILESHAYAAKLMKHLGIDGIESDGQGGVQVMSGGGCKTEPPPDDEGP